LTGGIGKEKKLPKGRSLNHLPPKVEKRGTNGETAKGASGAVSSKTLKRENLY